MHFHKCGCPVHHLLKHRFDPATLGRIPNRRNFTFEPQLAQQAQAVVGKRCQLKQHILEVELARGQPLEVQIDLDLGMELLLRSVMPVQLDDLGYRAQGR
jgi:hypothetical protein